MGHTVEPHGLTSTELYNLEINLVSAPFFLGGGSHFPTLPPLVILLRVTDSTVTENSDTEIEYIFGKYHQNFYKMGTGHQV